ncbi:hypothetical protein FRB94_009658 [Tulasnella sp. JGI-2019a]|nr:hypothetical protein FRB94_009658 [Tulasnella sp. JGI-2019a]
MSAQWLHDNMDKFDWKSFNLPKIEFISSVPPVPQPIPAVMPTVAPPTFDSALGRAQVISGVKLAIQNINNIIDVLNHPVADKEDTIDLEYSPEAVTTFKVRSTECDHFTAVSTHLQEITDTIDHGQAQIDTADQDIAKNTALIEAKVKAISELTQITAHESQLLIHAQSNYDMAQRRLNETKAQQDRARIAQGAAIWMPVAAVALAIVDTKKEQSDVDSARAVVTTEEAPLKRDQGLAESYGADLKKLQQEGISLHATLINLQTKEAELKEQQSELNADSEYLGPLKANVDHCIHVVSAALGSTSKIDNMMSMNAVSVAIKGLLDALKDEDDFTGELAKLDAQGFAGLDKRIQAIQKASNKPTPNVRAP